MRLQELISTHKIALNLTHGDMVERSTLAGYPVSRKTWHRWINEDPSELPDKDTIRGIALTLHLSTQTVMDAAAESVGLPVNRAHVDETVQAITSLVEARSPAQQKMVLTFLRALTADFDSPDRYGTPE